MKKLLLSFLLIVSTTIAANADIIGQWAFTTSSTTLSPTTTDANVTNSNLSTGNSSTSVSLATSSPAGAFSGSWSTDPSFNTAGKYWEFSMTTNSGKQAFITSITFDALRTSTGPANIQVQYSLDGFATAGVSAGTFSNASTSSLSPFSLTAVPSTAIQGTLTVRIWGYNASSTGNFRINNITINGVTSTLPIVLNAFKAKANLQQVDLTWNTAAETNNSHFEILRSADGKTFNKIDEVKGAGNSTENRSYAYTDKDPLPGVNYYKLKQVDFDGQYSFSEVEAVKSNVAASNFKVAANKQNGTVKLTVYAANNGKATFKIYDLNGRKLAEQELNLSKGYSNVSVPFNGGNGLLIASLTTPTETLTQKFIQ